MKDK
jgi:hypothetical protein